MTKATTTSKPAKRSRAKSAASAVPTAINQTVLLRIEPRLRWTGSIDLVPLAGGGGRSVQVLCTDSKLKRDLEWRGWQASESAALIEAFNRIEAWVEETREQQRGPDRSRLLTVLDQLRVHRRQLVTEGVGSVPETQAEAAAKEEAVDEYEAAESNRDGTAWSLAEWTARLAERVDLDAWRRRAIPGIVEESLAGWYHDGLTITEAASEIEESIDGEIDLRDDEPSVPAVETVEIPLALLRPHPGNPRTSFTRIDELADSLKTQGQLVEAIGRWRDGTSENGGQRYVELLAGHRRFRAAELAGLTSLRVRIVEASDAQAVEIMGRDNEDRENFDAVAKARWYRLMLDQLQLSQRQLAERIGVSQADIANHVRILDLPEEWQQRVITQEITATQARMLAPWSERPAVLANVEQSLREDKDNDWTTADWQRELQSAIDDVTLTCEPGRYYSAEVGSEKKRRWIHGYCRFTEQEIQQHAKELDIVEVVWRGKTERRAFNIRRWLELHGNAEKRYAEQEAAKATRSNAAKSKKGKQSEPEAAAQADQQRRAKQAEVLARRLAEYRVRWYQGQILDRLDHEGEEEQLDGEHLLRLLLYFGAHYGSAHSIHHDRRDSLLDAVRDVLPARAVKGLQGTDGLWQVLAGAAEPDLWRVLAGTLRRWLERDPFSNYADLQPDDLPAMAQSLGIDLARDWRVDDRFLALHTRDQLLERARAWKLPTGELAGLKRDELIAAILAADQVRRLPVPKELR